MADVHTQPSFKIILGCGKQKKSTPVSYHNINFIEPTITALTIA